MNLRDLVYVIEVAKHQNFTRASEATAVSQPALSNQIKKLEAELGFNIFDRGKDGVALTAFGEDFVANARDITALVDRFSDIAEKHRQVEVTPMRLGITPTLAAYLSRYFRDLFAELYPNMRLVVVEKYPAELAQMVEDKTVDVAFIARKSFESLYQDTKHQLNFTPLWQEPVFLGVRKGHPLAQRSGIWAHEVPVDLLIRFDTSFGYDLEQDLPKTTKDVSDLVGIDVRSARFETVCRHVAQSDACTMINAIAAAQFKNDDFGLEFIPFKDEGNTRELGGLTRTQYPRPQVIENMRAYIQETPPRGTLAL